MADAKDLQVLCGPPYYAGSYPVTLSRKTVSGDNFEDPAQEQTDRTEAGRACGQLQRSRGPQSHRALLLLDRGNLGEYPLVARRPHKGRLQVRGLGTLISSSPRPLVVDLEVLTNAG